MKDLWLLQLQKEIESLLYIKDLILYKFWDVLKKHCK